MSEWSSALFRARRRRRLEPLSFSEIENRGDEENEGEDRYPPKRRIADPEGVGEVHAEDRGDEGGDEEDCGQNGEELHDIVRASREEGLIRIFERLDGFLECFEERCDLFDPAGEVSKVGSGVWAKKCRRRIVEGTEDRTCR